MLKISKLVNNIRFYSIKHATKKPIKYTSTINLPKTKFPNRLSAAKREEVEKQLLESTFAKAYAYQEAHKQEPTFVLHDGPPYANGDLHMGHAVNKILKDITLRQHVTKGQKIHYVPGWDCHGLPIELKAMSADSQKSSALEIRRKSRQFAMETIKRQKAEFRSWGILSDWHNPDNIYLTFSPEFLTNQLHMFLDLYEKSLVYRDLKPVYWSPSSRTALAEAELEYDSNFVSPSVYVRFAVDLTKVDVKYANAKIYALVWTTTPWTLPSNQAICFNEELEYALVRIKNCDMASNDELYLIASDLIEAFEEATQFKCEHVEKVASSDLMHCTYRHPILDDETTLPFFHAGHVQDTKGTGLVHTAPAHGPEDFLVSLEKNLPVKSFVNELGIYTSDAPDFLCGKTVLDEGNDLVLEHISSDVIHSSKFTHSYPIDWRTKKPVIIRASEQWFINTGKLKERAAEEASKISVYPRHNSEASRKALLTQVRKRPYWCISRQRVWGVPIPVFYERTSGKILINRSVINHICSRIAKEGNVDFWWSESVEEILPRSLLEDLNVKAEDLVKSADIFDIWFDSGSTWSAVLKGEQVADLYLEGYDQFTGWFQSSLLTSVAARDQAPYKALFVHGFTVDEKGLKMSKSLGNVISPKDITQKYGVDVLRWWVASHGTNNMSIIVSDALMQQAAEQVSKIRATLRYLNGVIGVRDVTESAEDDHEGRPAVSDHLHLNKYLLSSLTSYIQEIQNSYDLYEYNRVVAQVQNFIANHISAVYVHLIKDRLYCSNNEDFNSIRRTLTECYKILCKSLWPITPFLVEESWSYYDASSSFHEQSITVDSRWKDPHVEDVIHTALEVKRLINQSSSDTNSWTLAVTIECSTADKLKLLQHLQPSLDCTATDTELCEVLQVGQVHLKSDYGSGEQYHITVEPLKGALCPRCRRFTVDDENCICARCTKVLNAKADD